MILFGITEKHEIIKNRLSDKIVNINMNIQGRADLKVSGKRKSKLRHFN
jgi:hypothetical protein